MNTKLLTVDSIDYLRNERLSFGEDPLYARVVPGDHIIFMDEARVSRVSGFHIKRFAATSCVHLYSAGYMSYSGSNLDLDTEVGRYCSLAWNIHFIPFLHPIGAISTNPFVYSKSEHFDLNHLSVLHSSAQEADSTRELVANPQKDRTTIGNDIWIGADVVLARGISIGTGSIIACNSVVTKSIEPYSIVGGNPARLIKKRFPEDLVQELLASEWWDYNYLDFCDLPIADPSAFIKDFLVRKRSIEKYCPGYIDLKSIP